MPCDPQDFRCLVTQAPFFWTKQWYAVALLESLDPRKPHPLKLLGRELVLWQNTSGKWQCFEDRCSHRNAPLSGLLRHLPWHTGHIQDIKCITCDVQVQKYSRTSDDFRAPLPLVRLCECPMTLVTALHYRMCDSRSPLLLQSPSPVLSDQRMKEETVHLAEWSYCHCRGACAGRHADVQLPRLAVHRGRQVRGRASSGGNARQRTRLRQPAQLRCLLPHHGAPLAAAPAPNAPIFL